MFPKTIEEDDDIYCDLDDEFPVQESQENTQSEDEEDED